MNRAQRAARLHGIYCIVNENERVVALARAALDAGVRIVQYRAKRAMVPEHLRALRDLTRACGALLIVNDDWRAARDCDADGVHLGPDDDGFSRVAAVRSELGDRLIGLSCGTVEEARVADASDVDYIGVGAVYATASKADAGAPIGVNGLRRVASATALPVAAIGGITAEHLPDVRATGVAMAAVISAIAQAPDARAAAQDLVRAWDEAGP